MNNPVEKANYSGIVGTTASSGMPNHLFGGTFVGGSAFIVDLPRSHLGLPPMVTSQATKEEADAVRWQWLADKLASLELNAEKVDAKLAAAEAKVGLWQFACVILGILLTALAVNVFVR
jgi:hypothetical protein